MNTPPDLTAVDRGNKFLAPPLRGDQPCRLIRFEKWPFENNFLIGHCVIDFRGWQINRVPIFRRKDGSLSVGVPSVPQLDHAGVQLRDDAGKRKYAPLMSFSGDGKERWERAVLRALSDAGVDL